jgi:hypothetical protein
MYSWTITIKYKRKCYIIKILKKKFESKQDLSRTTGGHDELITRYSWYGVQCSAPDALPFFFFFLLLYYYYLKNTTKMNSSSCRGTCTCPIDRTDPRVRDHTRSAASTRSHPTHCRRTRYPVSILFPALRSRARAASSSVHRWSVRAACRRSLSWSASP